LTISWDGKPEYIELSRDPEGIEIAREILLGTNEWVFHNAKFDLHVLINTGVLGLDDLADEGWRRIHDTELLSRLHYEHGVGERGSHALKALARDYLGVSTDEERVLKEAKRTTKAETYDALPRSIVVPYALEDARITELIFVKLGAFVAKSPDKEALYDLERHLTVRLLQMEREGMGIDLQALTTADKLLDTEVTSLRQSIRQLVPDTVLPKGIYTDPSTGKERKRIKDKTVEFNPNSAKQLAEELQKRGCVLTKKTESGQLSTDEEVLTALSGQDELARLVLDLRRKSKISGTYLEPLARRAHTNSDGVSRVTANFRIAAARTGRMSCTEPNLQNIPRSDKTVRACFIPKRDALLYFDYSNVEMVLAAAFSQDERLCQAIKDGADLHGLTTRLLFGISEDEFALTDEQRQVGKVMNFQSLYGASAPRVKAELDSRGIATSIDEADDLLTRFWSAYPGLLDLRTQLELTHAERGSIKTLAGRELHVDSEHKLINALIQGSAADLIEMAFVRVSTYLDQHQSRLVCVIHDELQVDVCDSEIDQLVEDIPALMTDFPDINKFAPLTVDCEITRSNWAEKAPFEQEVAA
jgi:DNA polymerase-1